jgi:superfamily I DNA/RNA helicase
MPDFIFRLPSINNLTDAQQIAYYEQRGILITGGPGSGKTVVSIFRFLRQIAEGQNAIFFTYNRTLMSSVRGTLRQRADLLLPDLNETQVERIVNSNIGSMFEWYYANFNVFLKDVSNENIINNFTSHITNGNQQFHELFIDEAQDLRPGIIAELYRIASKVSCGADRAQDIQGQYRGPADDIIFELLQAQSPTTVRQELTQNFRNTKEIFEFARNFVPEDDNVQQIDISLLGTGESPDIIGNLTIEQQLETILQIIKDNPNNNIGILVHTKKEIILIKEFLEKNGYSCAADAADNLSFSYYYSGMDGAHKQAVESKLRTPFILTFESCKGLEFDTVILPFFYKANWALNNFKPTNDNPELDASGNPKTWATPNHYYVACTRAKSQLYIFFDNKPDILDFWDNEDKEIVEDNIADDLLF